MSKFLASGNLTALNKLKDECPPSHYIRPIAVEETLRRLTGKCLCTLVKEKASDFFQPLQFGVSCALGSEKVTLGLRCCRDEHWDSDKFVVLKIDMRNAFNLVSRQTLLDKCATPAIGQLMQQAQLALCYAGFGLRSLSYHSCAAFITSVCSSGFGDRDNQYLAQAITLFNSHVL